MPAITFPTGTSHVKQVCADGRIIIVNKNGLRFVDSMSPLVYGTYIGGVFTPYAPPQVNPAPVVIPPPQAAPVPVVRPVVVLPAAPAVVGAEGKIKTKFIEDMVIAGRHTAKQIAEMTVAVYGGDLAKTQHYVCSTPFRLKAKGINARFLPARGARVINPEPETTAANA